MKQLLKAYNAIPEGLPTPSQMWAKLTGSTEYTLTLEELQERLLDYFGGI